MFNNTSALFVYYVIIQSVLTNHVQNILMFPALYGATTCRGCACIFVFTRTTITTFISSIFYSIFRCVFKKESLVTCWTNVNILFFVIHEFLLAKFIIFSRVISSCFLYIYFHPIINTVFNFSSIIITCVS